MVPGDWIPTSCEPGKSISLRNSCPRRRTRWRGTHGPPTGEDIDTAIIRAIQERLARTPRRRAADEEATIEALFDRLAQLPVLDRRSPEEIIGYGPDGLPH